MPRDSSGNYTLPSGNPVATGTTIEAAWANPTMSDIKQALTDSLDRYGRGGMQAPFKFLDGTITQPGFTWTSETASGIYRAGAQDQRVTIFGQDRMRWTAAGTDLWTGSAWTPVFTQALYNSQVATSLAPYTQRAVAETIGGAWVFSAVADFRAGLAADPFMSVGGAATGEKYIRLSNNNVPAGFDIVLGANGLQAGFINRPFGAFSLYVDIVTNQVNIPNALNVTGTLGALGALNVTGAAVFSTGVSFLTNINVVNDIFLGGSNPGAKRFRLSNNLFTTGFDYTLDSTGAIVGFYNPSLALWSLQFSTATNAVTIPGALSVNGAFTFGGATPAPTTRSIATTNSLTGGGDLSADRTLQLVGDSLTPGTSFYYGTNASGVKGYFALSGVVGVPEAPIDGVAYARQNASWVSLAGGGAFVLKTGDTMSGALNIITSTSTRLLSLESTAPKWGIKQTTAPVDEGRYEFRVGSGLLSLLMVNDAESATRGLLSFVRSGGIVCTGINYGNGTDYPTHTFLGNVSATQNIAPLYTKTPVRAVAAQANGGMTLLNVNSADGVNNPRTCLFTDGAGAAIGIDYTYSSGIAAFEFQAAGVKTFNYNQLGMNLFTGRYIQFNNPADTEVASISRDVTNFVINSGTGGVLSLQNSGTAAFKIDASVAALYAGRSYVGYDSTNLEYFTIQASTGSGVNYNTFPGVAHNFNINGAARFSVGSSSSNLYGGSSLQIYDSTNAESGIISRSLTALVIDAGVGGFVRLSAGGNTMAEFEDVATGIRFLNSVGLRSSASLVFYNAANTVSRTLSLNASNEIQTSSRGALTGWLDAALTTGTIAIATSAPAATGTPGAIVLVYE